MTSYRKKRKRRINLNIVHISIEAPLGELLYELDQTYHRELEAELAELSKKVDSMNLQETCIKEFMDKAKSNIEMSEVTPKLLNLFVARIEVSERESRKTAVR
ncbi:DUF4368 domain-containing protein [Ruminococcus flavefaciens]|uniref:DUF4368 domain-containing protein n=1 Tax=Ruminococcus flavefaciens TaxID=1265 RepID=UPI00092FDD63|nr:DUF4368 domain-containing protein [Ruminococcus flavefaciens]